MDPWEQVVGQPAARSILRTAATRDEVPHAWLFVGPAGVGQRETVLAFAADLNCPSGEGSACGACGTCARIARGTHPAVREFEPEGAFHLVDAVRDEWIPAATLTLLEGRRKVLRIAAADRMNEAAQSAFLKVLEEPPPSVVWVLEADDDLVLLETVVSRCRRVDFAPWSASDLGAQAARLGVPASERDEIVRAALGSPQRLAELADPDVRDARELVLDVVDRLVRTGPGGAVPLARELDAWARSRTRARRAVSDTERARMEEAFGGEWPPGLKNRVDRRLQRQEREERQRALRALLDDLAGYLRDVLVAGAGGGTLVNEAHGQRLREDAARVGPALALEGLQAVAEAADALERNGNPELQLERLLLRIAVPLQLTS